MSTATLPQTRPVNPATNFRDWAGQVVGFFRENRLFTAGVVLLLGLYVFALVGLALTNPKGSDMGAVPLNLAPSAQHVLGTDGLGRDMFAVMVIGIPNMFKIGFLAGAVGVLIGTIIGLFAGYYRGLPDAIFSSFADVMLVIPSLAVLITVSAYVRVVSVELMAVIVGLLSWPLSARVIRSQTLSLRERLFVQVAKLSGQNDFEIITRQILPNVTAYLAASFVGAVSGGILASVGLEVLGLGPQNVPTIGRALYYAFKGSALFKGEWWWWAPPVVTLAIIFTGLFWISLSLDKYANPRLKSSSGG